MNPIPMTDLAGIYSPNPSYLQIRSRINHLIDRYISIPILSRNLSDLPSQFTNPHQRPWQRIDWQAISPDQIVGIDPALFITIVAGATEIEAPIREYSQESWNYMQALHPQMAYFMGGEQYQDGSSKKVGIWEKEERQHAPAFGKIYAQLTGEKLYPKPNSVLGYQPSDDLWVDLYQHTISRISTEWGAVSVYLWLMAHSTGALQQAIAQPLQDEINHLAKFWGFSRWAFAAPYWQQCNDVSHYLLTLLRHQQQERTHGQDLMRKAMNRHELVHGIEMAFVFARIMVRLRTWQSELSNSFLQHLLGEELMIIA
jgi:hypothetical protein